MNNEFGMLIRKNLLKAGLSGASEIFKAKKTENFGNTESFWKIKNLRIRFIKDRGQVFVDLGSAFDESQFFIFDDIALLMKWQTLDEIIRVTEPLDLLFSLNLIKNDLGVLEVLFSKNELSSTSMKLNEISKAKAQARFGKE